MKNGNELSNIYEKPAIYETIELLDDSSLLPSPMTDSPEVIAEKIKFIKEAEAVIQAIKSGEIEGEYFEF